MAPDERSTDIAAHRPDVFTFRRFRIAEVGGDRAAEMTAGRAELTIGTAQGNDLVLDDPTVSRHHCAIAVTPRGFQLRDLGSTNGTWLGGHRVELAYLKPKSTFRVGGITLGFDWLDEEIREE